MPTLRKLKRQIHTLAHLACHLLPKCDMLIDRLPISLRFVARTYHHKSTTEL
jgi:hypothetical protein